jgi:hypothetical protein
MILDALNIYFVCLQKYKNLCETDSFFPHNFCTFAPSLAKGIPCKSATVPAAVSPRKACQTSHCTAHLYGKATGSDKSEDLPDKEFNCKPSRTRATLSAAISIASCDGFAKHQVDTETGVATSLGEIGQGTQLTGLFMVPQPTPPEPEIIHEIYVEGFTEPAWGEHPDFDLEVAPDAHYSIDAVDWLWGDGTTNGALAEEDVFNNEDFSYFMILTISPEEGYCFTDETTVFYNGDSSPLAQTYVFTSGKFLAMTINYYVTNPTGISELTTPSVALWPNPAVNILYLDVTNGTSVSVFDMTGRMVMQESYIGKLDVSRLVPGIYAIKAEGCLAKFVKE